MKTSNLILSAAFAAAALFLIVATVRARVALPEAVAPSGKTVREARDAFPLRHLRLDLPVLLLLRAGVPEVTVEGDAAYTALLEDTDDDPAVLALALRDGATLPLGARMRVHVSTPTLTHLELHGAVEARSEGALDFPRLRVETHGAPTLDLEVRGADSLGVYGSGSVTGSLRGDVGVLTVRNSGSVDLDARALTARRATVELSGGGLVRVHADSTLDLALSGSPEVEYDGSPRVNAEVSGSGRVRSVH